MDNFIVSARKYRPTTFESVVGQKALTSTLKNAIKSGRLGHAYLFCGPRGVGKTTCARIFAKSINCLTPTAEGNPCNTCESCVAFNEQRSYNIHELDAASNNSIEDIRAIIDQVRIPPQVGRYKVFIVDEVHMLSTAAFNAFLKTLEEPPSHVVYILATTEKHKLLPTIISRCQIYDFTRIELSDITDHLAYVAQQEGVQYEAEALGVIAQKADGGMRDALSMFDQMVSFTQGNLTYQKVIENLNVLDYEYYFRLTEWFLKKDVSQSLLLFNDVLAKGFDGSQFIGGLASHFRNLLVSRDESTLELLEVSGDVRHRYAEQAKHCPIPFLYRAIKLCNDCDMNYRASRNKRLLVELTLIQVTQALDDESSGRSPKKTLKPIFASVANAQQTQAVPSNAQPQVGATSPSATSPADITSAQPAVVPTSVSAVQPSASVVQPVSPTAARNTAQLRPIQMVSMRRPSADAAAAQAANAKEGAASRNTQHIPTVKYGDNPFTENEVIQQWFKFAGELPREEVAMAGRMRNSQPKLIDTNLFEVTVENHMVANYFKELAPRIETYMRKGLRNDRVKMTIRVIEGYEKRRAYTPRDKFQQLASNNASFATLAQELGLELN